MKYTRENIKGLVVRRGGVCEYTITDVLSYDVYLRLSRNNRLYYLDVDHALKYLNSGKWQVAGDKSSANYQTELTYQIY